MMTREKCICHTPLEPHPVSISSPSLSNLLHFLPGFLRLYPASLSFPVPGAARQMSELPVVCTMFEQSTDSWQSFLFHRFLLHPFPSLHSQVYFLPLRSLTGFCFCFSFFSVSSQRMAFEGFTMATKLIKLFELQCLSNNKFHNPI